MAGAQCREVGREGDATDFVELCIVGVREGAARTAGGREEAARTAAGGRGGLAARKARCRCVCAPSPRCTGKGKGREGKGKGRWAGLQNPLGLAGCTFEAYLQNAGCGRCLEMCFCRVAVAGNQASPHLPTS